MATAQLAPEIYSAQQTKAGVAIGEGKGLQKEGEVLGPQFGGLYPPSNVAYEILPLEDRPTGRPSRISFAGLRDPRLRMVRAIPLDVTVEESTVVVSWAEIDEFGTGETLSAALDDFADSLRELHHQLFAVSVALGPDLQKVKATIENYIQPSR